MMQGLCFVAWILLYVVWNCREPELDLDATIQDAASFVVWSWHELHIQFLFFYNILIRKCWTWIYVSYSFSFFKHLHTQIFAPWDKLGFSFFFHSLGIYCWNWNLLLKSFVEFEFQIQEIFILNDFLKEKRNEKKEKKRNKSWNK